MVFKFETRETKLTKSSILAHRTISPKSRWRKTTWKSWTELFVALCGVSVGLANFWKMPFYMYKHGGLTFLFAYLVVIWLIGKPLYFMELAMGQFSRHGTFKLFKTFSRMWMGVGITQSIICLTSSSVYSSLMSISLYYLSQSFHENLPWDFCTPDLGPVCYPTGDPDVYFNETTADHASAFLFFNHYGLKMEGHESTIFSFTNWPLAIVSIFSWIVSGAALSFGVKSYSKFCYMSILFPNMMILILFLRSTLRPGAINGMKYFLPNWEKLYDYNVWFSAIQLCLTNLCIGYGIIPTLGSYNTLHFNLRKITMFVMIIHVCCGILCCLSVFCSLGTLSYKLGINVEDIVVRDHFYLAFVIYPVTITYFDKPSYLHAVLFFITLFLLGICNLAGAMLVVATNVLENFSFIDHWKLALIITAIGYLMSLPYCCHGGFWITQVVDLYGDNFPMMTVSIIQIFIISYSYGLLNFVWDIEFMVGKPAPTLFLRLRWGIIIPIFLILLFIVNFIYIFDRAVEIKYRTTELIWGFSLYGIICSPILICAIRYLLKSKSSRRRRTMKGFQSWSLRKRGVILEYSKFREKKFDALDLDRDNHCKCLEIALTRKYV